MAKFVTVATFAEVPKAEIARNILTEGGVKSYLSDSELVAMDWLIANAIGGVKVQVAEADAERAVELLAQAKEMQANLVGEEITDEELDRQAMAEEAEGEYDDVDESEDASSAPVEPSQFRKFSDAPARIPEQPVAVRQPPEAVPIEGTGELSERDRSAKRAFIIGWFGLAIPPLAVVALYFFIAAAFGSGPISTRGRFNLWVSAMLVIPATIIAATFFNMFR